MIFGKNFIEKLRKILCEDWEKLFLMPCELNYVLLLKGLLGCQTMNSLWDKLSHESSSRIIVV
jgi:hypothetical protein